MTIMDVRGDFVPTASGVTYSEPVPPNCYYIYNGDRRYQISADEFPEYAEVVEILKGRGEIVKNMNPQEFGTKLDSILHDKIHLRYEEARGMALSMGK